LGNVRVSFTREGAQATIVEKNDYYAFGLKHGTTSDTSGVNYNYEYNGKEFQQEIGMYDYGARFYMPDIGRWGVVDPLAEVYRRHSPYSYAVNNPIVFVDPDGRGVEYNWGTGDYESIDSNGTRTTLDEWDAMNYLLSQSYSVKAYRTNALGAVNQNSGGVDEGGSSLSPWMQNNIGITPAVAGIYAHAAMANFFKTNRFLSKNWFAEKTQSIWKWDLKMRPDLYYMNGGTNSVWELKPRSHFMESSLSFKGRYQVQGYADALTMLKHQKFAVGSSEGAPIPPINGQVLSHMGYRFSYEVPMGTDGMIYYNCLNCTPESQKQPQVDMKAVENTVTAAAVLYLIYKIGVGVATWECGGCGVLVTP